MFTSVVFENEIENDRKMRENLQKERIEYSSFINRLEIDPISLNKNYITMQKRDSNKIESMKNSNKLNLKNQIDGQNQEFEKYFKFIETENNNNPDLRLNFGKANFDTLMNNQCPLPPGKIPIKNYVQTLPATHSQNIKNEMKNICLNDSKDNINKIYNLINKKDQKNQRKQLSTQVLSDHYKSFDQVSLASRRVDIDNENKIIRKRIFLGTPGQSNQNSNIINNIQDDATPKFNGNVPCFLPKVSNSRIHSGKKKENSISQVKDVRNENHEVNKSLRSSKNSKIKKIKTPNIEINSGIIRHESKEKKKACCFIFACFA